MFTKQIHATDLPGDTSEDYVECVPLVLFGEVQPWHHEPQLCFFEETRAFCAGSMLGSMPADSCCL